MFQTTNQNQPDMTVLVLFSQHHSVKSFVFHTHTQLVHYPTGLKATAVKTLKGTSCSQWGVPTRPGPYFWVPDLISQRQTWIQ